MKPITISSDYTHDYTAALKKVKSLEDLRRVLNEFAPVVQDAIQGAPKDEEEFEAFIKGMKKERRKVFAGEEFSQKCGKVLMPDILLVTTHHAERFNVRWGLMFIQLHEVGHIIYDEKSKAYNYINQKPQAE